MIGQNTNLTHEITLRVDGKPINISDVELVEFSFGELIKIYPSEEVVYDNERFYVRLTQEETKEFEDSLPVQVRVKFSNGDVPLSRKKVVPINESLSKAVL